MRYKTFNPKYLRIELSVALSVMVCGLVQGWTMLYSCKANGSKGSGRDRRQ